ncbi:MAG: hypothetical protein C4523_20480 [Myxococcales bacterium]|nr:MAG: hypothetical protein C4523_20480 [Myxococcales bacterium]
MIKINLLPVKQAKKRGAGQRELVLFVLVLVVLGFGLYRVQAANGTTMEGLHAKEKEIQAEMGRLEELIGNITQFQQKREDLKKKLDIIELLKKNKTGPVRILDELAVLIPKKVWLEELVEQAGSLRLVGSATDNKEIAVFMKNLEGSKFFSDVTLLSIDQTKSTTTPVPVMKYSITLKYQVPQS